MVAVWRKMNGTHYMTHVINDFGPNNIGRNARRSGIFKRMASRRPGRRTTRRAARVVAMDSSGVCPEFVRARLVICASAIAQIAQYRRPRATLEPHPSRWWWWLGVHVAAGCKLYTQPPPPLLPLCGNGVAGKMGGRALAQASDFTRLGFMSLSIRAEWWRPSPTRWARPARVVVARILDEESETYTHTLSHCLVAVVSHSQKHPARPPARI
jgi:hypothetical protein